MDGSSWKTNRPKWSRVLGVKDYISTGPFLKHKLKEMLKYTGKDLNPSRSPFRDRQWRMVERRLGSFHRL
jgi:hypothetical protein